MQMKLLIAALLAVFSTNVLAEGLGLTMTLMSTSPLFESQVTGSRCGICWTSK